MVLAAREVGRDDAGAAVADEAAERVADSDAPEAGAQENGPVRRAILLRPGFRRVGVGYAFGSFIGHGGAGVVTADFAGR